MEQISKVCKEGDYGACEPMIYPPDLLNKAAAERSAFLEPLSARVDVGQHLKQRIEEFRVISKLFMLYIILLRCTMQNGVPGLLDIYRSYGRLPRRLGWRLQAFQIKDGVLQYCKQDMV